MRQVTVGKMWMLAFLMAGFVAGCGSTQTPTTSGGSPVGPPLGVTVTFGSFGGGSGATNQGINTVINGDLGTTAASTSVTGFHDAGPGCTYTETGSNVGVVKGKIFTAAPPPTVGCPSEGTGTTAATATQASVDAIAAWNNLSPASRPGGTDPGAGQLGCTRPRSRHLQSRRRFVPDHRNGSDFGCPRRCERRVGIPGSRQSYRRRRWSTSQRHPRQRRAGQERVLVRGQRGHDQCGRWRHHGGHDHR